MPYERLDQDLAPLGVFLARLFRNVAIAAALIGLSLLAGMWGYHVLEGMAWLDAFANAAMILSGMGPLTAMRTDAGKLFAGFYALYSGLFLILAAGLVITPLFHRFLHRLHLDEEEDEDGTASPKGG